MAKAVPSAPHVTLNLEVTGNFARSGSQQSPVDTQPLYLASNGVQGKLSLKYNESAFPIRSRDIVKVSLNGSFLIRKPWKGHGAVQKYRQLESSFLDLVDVSRMVNTETSVGETHVDFSFVLPKAVSYSTGSLEGQKIFNGKDHSLWSSLPSSLSAESVVTADMNGGSQRIYGKIVYTLRAQVFRGNSLLGHVARRIRIYNDVDIRPPICITDFPAEYRCLQQKPLRRRFRKTGSSFSAAVTEPAPFLFRSSEDSASTILSMSFALNVPSGRQTGEALRPMPEALEATLTWQLKSLTFLSVHPMTSVPAIVQSWRETSASMITVVGQQHRLKWTLSPGDDPSIALTESPGNSWSGTLKFPLFITKPMLPAPPLFTPFISRRYNLVLWVKLVGIRSGKTTLQLEIPVQIAYQQEKASIGSTELPPSYQGSDAVEPGDDGGAMEVPIYSP